LFQNIIRTDDARNLVNVVSCSRIVVLWSWMALMKTIADIVTVLAFSLLDLLLSLFVAMRHPEFSPSAEFQSSISSDVSAVI
jgi:hypothetical protein